MCGIFGYWAAAEDEWREELAWKRLDNKWAGASRAPSEQIDTARAMAAELRHRGPDDHGFWVEPRAGVLLGHTRLAIRDRAQSGAQPMVSADGRWVLSYNGELYGIDAARRRLSSAGVSFRGHSDTEVLLEACAIWGVERAAAELGGMFAFALWDRRDRQLWFGRDRFGKKPLYVMQTARGLWFASELKAFHAAGLDLGSISTTSLSEFLQTGVVPDERCIFDQVSKVRAGTLQRYAAARSAPSEHRYWSLETTLRAARDGPRAQDFDACGAMAENLLERAVQERLVADVPVGALLSGGVDSATVVALMAASGVPPKTFTVGFDEPDYDESTAAREVAAALGTEHRTLRVGTEAALAIVPQLATIYDEPFADASQIPTVLISRMVREHVSVCLTGDGADEIFGGYNRHRWIRSLMRYSAWVPSAARSLLAASVQSIAPGRIDSGFSTLLKQKAPTAAGQKAHKLAALSAQSGFPALYRELTAQGRGVLNREQLADDRGGHHLGGEFLTDPVERLMYLDTEHYLRDDILVKVDRASMSCSLEVRNPYLDHRLFEFVWQLPRGYRVDGTVTKRLLRSIAARHLPASVLQRPKSGFAAPIGHWLRAPLREWAEDLLRPAYLADIEIVDQKSVRNLWQSHQRGEVNAQYALWPLLMFQAWRARWLGG